MAVAPLCNLCECTYHRVAMADFCCSFHHDGKSALAGVVGGGGGGCTPTPPFHSIYHYVQSCSVRSAEYRHTHPISSLPLYVLCGTCQVDLSGRKRDGSFKLLWVEKFAKLLTEIAVCKYMEDSMDWRRKHISHKFPLCSLSQDFPNNRPNNLRFFKCYG